jgi:ATP/maltotriose-dependent transcriptional regulator MalT
LRSDPDGAREQLAYAVELVEQGPLTVAKVRAFAQQARNESVSGARDKAAELAQRALSMAEELGDDELISHTLNTLGMVHVGKGDPAGIAELERSVEFATASNSPEAIHTTLNNLANSQWLIGDLEGASASLAKAREAAERFGHSSALLWLEIEDMLDHDLRGEWDEALACSNAFLESIEGRKNRLRGTARHVRALVFVARGDVDAAEAEAKLVLEEARKSQGEPLSPALAEVARVLVAAGRQAEADVLLDELFRDHQGSFGSHWMRELPHLLVELGRGDVYVAAVVDAPSSPWLEAGVAVATGNFVEAAESYERIGARATEAWTRLLAAEALVAQGRRREADEQLGRTLAFYRAARATPYVRRGELLLAATG